MTGLDRLRELADDMFEKDLWASIRGGMDDKYGTDMWDDKTVNGLLCEIADQIEAEQEERVTRRLEDREAAEWVRAHGGLDSVKKLLGWVVGHCSTKQQLDFDFWLSGRVMYELGFEEDMADRDEVERRLLARLMPEGIEWPRYESGESVGFGDDVSRHGEDFEANVIALYRDGSFSLNFWAYSKGERVKRPAVPASDGEPLEVGQTVWDVISGIEFTVIGLPRSVEYQAVKLRLDDGAVTGLDPDRLTHERPDSWARIEADCMQDAKDYCEEHGIEPEYPKHIGKAKCEDLVRRCRALAERERGE